MQDFVYHRPSRLDEAASLLKANADAKLLAGGMTLLPTMKQRLADPAALIDLAGVNELRGIREEGGALVIGAMTRHDEVASSALVHARLPVLAGLAATIGDAQVRNRGTIGGSIANADPAADYPAAIVGLGALVRTNSREIAADAFFTGLFETALRADEIVREVAFPLPRRAGYAKFANPASRYALVGVFCAETGAGIRVAVTGAGVSVFRVKTMEDALARDYSAGALQDIRVPMAGLNADIHASAEYRAHLVGVMAQRAVAA